MDRSAATSDRSRHAPSAGPEDPFRELRVRRVFTSEVHGDLAVDGPGAAVGRREDGVADGLERRRAAIAPFPWSWLHQVHGDRVVVVHVAGEHAGTDADASVTDVPGAVLAVQTADCAGVLLSGIRVGTDGEPVAVIGAAHAGWRGLVAGVLQRTVGAMQTLGAGDITWQLGPCISPAAYEFGEDDLASLVARYDHSVQGVTTDGRPALDLRAGVRAALAETEAAEETGHHVACTATEPGYYSWRARRDAGRQAAVTWIEPA